jgi:hypothetical protein
MAFIFWAIGQIGPIFVRGIVIPGVVVEPFNNAETVVSITATIITLIFLVRAASDVLYFVDVWTEIITKRLGIKEERPLKRVARDLVYIILAILLATAVTPIIFPIPQIGGYLSIAISLTALGVFLILIYDIGRVLHDVLQEKTLKIAEWIASLAGERNRNNEKNNEQKIVNEQ